MVEMSRPCEVGHLTSVIEDECGANESKESQAPEELDRRGGGLKSSKKRKVRGGVNSTFPLVFVPPFLG